MKLVGESYQLYKNMLQNEGLPEGYVSMLESMCEFLQKAFEELIKKNMRSAELEFARFREMEQASVQIFQEDLEKLGHTFKQVQETFSIEKKRKLI